MFSKKKNSVRLAIPVLCAALLALTACTNASETTGGGPTAAGSASAAPVAVDKQAQALLPADIKTQGSITIASDPSYAPFEYLGPDGKTMTGFDIALTDHLAAMLGLKANHEAATFDTIIPGLTSGRYDAGMSAFSITAERKQTVDFVPYMQGGTALGVLKGNPKNLHLQDNSLCGHTVAVQSGSVQAQVQAPAFSQQCTAAGKQPIDIKSFPTQSDANLALTSGRVDALISTSTTLNYQGQQAGGKFEAVAGPPYQPKGVGMVVKKGSQLTAALSAAMKTLIASPDYKTLFTTWNIPVDNMLTLSDFETYAQ